MAAQQEKEFNFAPLQTSLTTGHRIVLDLGSSKELALRSKP